VSGELGSDAAATQPSQHRHQQRQQPDERGIYQCEAPDTAVLPRHETERLVAGPEGKATQNAGWVYVPRAGISRWRSQRPGVARRAHLR
jgi:hypothetical protein